MSDLSAGFWMSVAVIAAAVALHQWAKNARIGRLQRRIDRADTKLRRLTGGKQ